MRWLLTAAKAVPGPPLDPQTFRASSVAAVARRFVYRWLVGDRWPPTFTAVGSAETVPSVVSSNLYVHLPFCESRCPHCPYTAFVAPATERAAYGAALHRELDRPVIAPMVAVGSAAAIGTREFAALCDSDDAYPEMLHAAVALARTVLDAATEHEPRHHPLQRHNATAPAARF